MRPTDIIAAPKGRFSLGQERLDDGGGPPRVGRFCDGQARHTPDPALPIGSFATGMDAPARARRVARKRRVDRTRSAA